MNRQRTEEGEREREIVKKEEGDSEARRRK